MSALVMFLASCLLVGCTQGHQASGSTASPAPAAADPVAAEQSRSGDAGWQVHGGASPQVLAGYSERTSVLPGQVLRLHLRSRRPRVHLQAYRSGYYRGTGGRLIWQGDVTALPPTAPVLLSSATRTWSANWPESTPISTTGWPAGHYLMVLDAGAGLRSWVPFTLRSPDVRGRVVLLTENTTWQAYNRYGGASLYQGPDGLRRDRAYAVSHDRPLDYGNGAGDYPGNELPLIRLADQLRLPLAFLTDTDLDAESGLLDGAAAIISLGHDEYYSSRMRQQVQHARETTGTNLAFFGANAIFRHIRLLPLHAVPDRLEVDYKSADLDPVTATNPSEATADWPFGPRPRPEDDLTGALYQCNPVQGALVLADPNSWITRGLGLHRGDILPDLLGSEYDSIISNPAAPTHITSVFHSPLTCHGHHQAADFAFYTAPSGAAGVDVGTSTWICALQDVCGSRHPNPHTRQTVTAITTRILRAFSHPAAGRDHPLPPPP